MYCEIPAVVAQWLTNQIMILSFKGLNPDTAGARRKIVKKVSKNTSIGTIVVGQSTLDPKFEGLNMFYTSNRTIITGKSNVRGQKYQHSG
jgi:hypothetical protein